MWLSSTETAFLSPLWCWGQMKCDGWMDAEKQHSHCAEFRFYEELNDFLPEEKKKKQFPYYFSGKPALKDAIEALGIPPTEVDLIMVNGESVPFTRSLMESDRVSVFPVFESLDISGLSLLREKPLRGVPRFVLDVHLGRLAKYMRMLGFDALYENTYSDDDIVEIVRHDPKRIVLTSERRLLNRSIITHGYCVRSREWRKQLEEVMRRCNLLSHVAPFSLCLTCNGRVIPVKKDEISGCVPLHISETFREFTICSRCGKVYWRGSHYSRMENFIRDFLMSLSAEGSEASATEAMNG
jgi:uncharacterized protein